MAPSINEDWEAGIKFKSADWIDGHVTYWQQEASGEVSHRLNDPSGESDNVDETQRWAYDLQVNLHLTNRYYEYVWYNPEGAQASFHSAGDGRAVYAGVTLDFWLV